jgi:ABC-type ATPase with predicted acetyltransferase domain
MLDSEENYEDSDDEVEYEYCRECGDELHPNDSPVCGMCFSDY